VPVVTYYGCIVCLRHGISFIHGASGTKMQLIVCLITSDLLIALYARSLLHRQNMDADDMLVI